MDRNSKTNSTSIEVGRQYVCQRPVRFLHPGETWSDVSLFLAPGMIITVIDGPARRLVKSLTHTGRVILVASIEFVQQARSGSAAQPAMSPC